MAYYTTVITVNEKGEPIKAEVTCGGTSRGFTDPDSGELTFSLSTKDGYSVSAKRYGQSVSSTVRGGERIVLRLK